jgi:hypothetical protein
MKDDEFWKLIQECKVPTASRNLTEQSKRLRAALSSLESEALLDFIRIFETNLWSVAYIANTGCSDGGFEEFRAWLISLGEQHFYESLKSCEYAARMVVDFTPRN